MRKIGVLSVLILCMIFMAVQSASAEAVVKQLYYQKKLTTAPAGSTTSTPVNFTFSLWDDPVAGTSVWEETKAISVTSTTRLISTYLGDMVSFDSRLVDFSEQLWVQVQDSSGAVIGTREKLGVVPYALFSATSDVPGVPGPQGEPGPMGPQGIRGIQGERRGYTPPHCQDTKLGCIWWISLSASPSVFLSQPKYTSCGVRYPRDSWSLSLL